MMSVTISGQQIGHISKVQHWVDEVNRHSSQHPTPPASQTSSCEFLSQQGPKASKAYAAHSKRKYKMSSSRSESPRKRARVAEGEDVLPEQSASVVSPTELTHRTRLTQPGRSNNSSPTRSISPVRDLFNELRLSSPAIHCVPPAGVHLPENATSLRRHLTEGFGEKIIPIGLKVSDLVQATSASAVNS